MTLSTSEKLVGENNGSNGEGTLKTLGEIGFA
jgi:hypothetical protein